MRLKKKCEKARKLQKSERIAVCRLVRQPSYSWILVLSLVVLFCLMLFASNFMEQSSCVQPDAPERMGVAMDEYTKSEMINQQMHLELKKKSNALEKKNLELLWNRDLSSFELQNERDVNIIDVMTVVIAFVMSNVLCERKNMEIDELWTFSFNHKRKIREITSDFNEYLFYFNSFDSFENIEKQVIKISKKIGTLKIGDMSSTGTSGGQMTDAERMAFNSQIDFLMTSIDSLQTDVGKQRKLIDDQKKTLDDVVKQRKQRKLIDAQKKTLGMNSELMDQKFLEMNDQLKSGEFIDEKLKNLQDLVNKLTSQEDQKLKFVMSNVLCERKNMEIDELWTFSDKHQRTKQEITNFLNEYQIYFNSFENIDKQVINIDEKLKNLQDLVNKLTSEEDQKLKDLENIVKKLTDEDMTSMKAEISTAKLMSEKLKSIRYKVNNLNLKEIDDALAKIEMMEDRLGDIKVDIVEGVMKESGFDDTYSKIKQMNYQDIMQLVILQQIDEKMRDSQAIATLSMNEIRATVVREIKREFGMFQADNINRTDYALASMGAEIVEYSKNYRSKLWRKLPFHRIKKWLFKEVTPPEFLISPGLHIEKCFAGRSGYVIIKLPVPLYPNGFSIDHIPRSLSPDPTTAPKKLRVWGFNQKRGDSVFFGEWEYDYDSVIQTFDYQPEEGKEKAFLRFKLEILSNYGNEALTCIYRFRIHGHRPIKALTP